MTIRNLLSIARESVVAWRLAAGLKSKLRFASDVLVSRALKWGHVPGFNDVRTVSLKDGTSLSYRLNRGDVQGIREVWMDGAYRLPFEMQPRIVVDLGSNIGLASAWFQRQFDCEQIIAVEANAANADLTRQNFVANAIPGQVLEAAIGPEDGEAQFESFDESNVGRIANGESATTNTVTVKMIAMESVLQLLPPDRRIDLVKMDIEGGEALLFSRNTSWLDRVDAIIAELHPDVVDCGPVVTAIETAGFRFVPGNSIFAGNLTAFVRKI